MSTQEPDDELTRAYQSASAADAGTPAKATRDAILAEARKAALRRQPAANDSRYLLRAVAGVAVLGVALVLWRQQDPLLPTQAPSQVATAAKAEAPAADAQGDNAAPATEARESFEAAPPPAADTALAENRRRSAGASIESRTESSAALAQDRALNLPRAAAPAMRTEATQSTPANGNAILRRAFAPQMQDAITPPAAAWVIEDSAGVVVRSGVVSSAAELTAIAISAQRDFLSQGLGPWRRLPATTSSGTDIDVHVAELK